VIEKNVQWDRIWRARREIFSMEANNSLSSLIKGNQKNKYLSSLATTRHVYFPFQGIKEKSFFKIS
jgi:hypothetical protein